MADLAKHTALITGATSGFGEHFTSTLSSAGATVIVAGRDEDKLKELVATIRQRGGNAGYCVFDLTDSASIREAVRQASKQHGPISILVNNAGVLDNRMAMTSSDELIDKLLFTNLRAPYVLCCELARQMKMSGVEGRIVNISSMSAFNYSGNGQALYSITKAALNRMTEVLAVEWSKYNINVNAIAPGIFEAGLIKRLFTEKKLAEFSDSVPRQRLSQVDDLDSTLLYLCSPDSRCVTGTVIKIDDGQEPR